MVCSGRFGGRGIADTDRRSRRQALAAGVAAWPLAVSIAACGGSESSSDSNEPAGTYPVKIVTAEFPAKQRLGETTLLRLGVRNTGHKALPSADRDDLGRRQGGPRLVAALRLPRPGTRPCSARPPGLGALGALPESERLGRNGRRRNLEPQDLRFRPVEAGHDDRGGLEAERGQEPGSYDVFYEVGAGLNGEAKAETAPGTQAGGSFTAEISSVPPETEVKDNGEVVEIGGKTHSGK